jgi:hypothetical protein
LRPTPAPAPPPRRIDRRAYTAASAAAIVMAVGLFVLFGGSEEHGLESVDDVNRQRAMEESEDNPVYESFALAMERTMLPPAWRAGEIEQAEDAMAQLRRITEISRPASMDLETQ